MVDIDYLRKNNLIIFESISGSRAYGTDLPHSDTDIKGVFILPKEIFYGLDYVEQVTNETNDIVFYELKRFMDLLYKNNPNLLELLCVPPDCVLFKHEIMNKVHAELFISKLCRQTFAGYALTQVKKAKGLNKKISSPVSKELKSVLDFCFVIHEQGSIPLRTWLQSNNFFQENCGLINISHMNDLYGVYYDDKKVHRYKGIVHSNDSNDVSLSSIPKGEKQIAIMSFNKNGYSVSCKEYKEYWEWVKNRNEERYENTTAHGKNYDSKNMMHVFRLLDMAEEIAARKEIIIRRPNREELLKIRSGEFDYDELVSRAEEKINRINKLYENCDLPEEPDKNLIERLLIEMREKFYDEKLNHQKF